MDHSSLVTYLCASHGHQNTPCAWHGTDRRELFCLTRHEPTNLAMVGRGIIAEDVYMGVMARGCSPCINSLDSMLHVPDSCRRPGKELAGSLQMACAHGARQAAHIHTACASCQVNAVIVTLLQPVREGGYKVALCVLCWNVLTSSILWAC